MKIFLHIFILLIISSSKVFPMMVQSNYDVVAWSKTNKQLLLKLIEHGPEGGSLTDYMIIDFDQKILNVYHFTNTMSPGDGSTPEWIKEENYKEARKKLVENINKNFDSIKIKESIFSGMFAKKRNLNIVAGSSKDKLIFEYVPTESSLFSKNIKIKLKNKKSVEFIDNKAHLDMFELELKDFSIVLEQSLVSVSPDYKYIFANFAIRYNDSDFATPGTSNYLELKHGKIINLELKTIEY
ncbi:MAG: hypothetical protein H6622_13510 [Halobacteriovoraceae bacterium]|nr:hypothetical protein [Halobacteriovoraceae bacterium]